MIHAGEEFIAMTLSEGSRPVVRTVLHRAVTCRLSSSSSIVWIFVSFAKRRISLIRFSSSVRGGLYEVKLTRILRQPYIRGCSRPGDFNIPIIEDRNSGSLINFSFVFPTVEENAKPSMADCNALSFSD